MRIAVVYSLPFHQWVLTTVVDAARVRFGEENVRTWTHHPLHDSDWLGSGSLRGLAEWRPDAVIVADMPFDPIRAVTTAPIVCTRHSIASRGNTWAPDLSTVDLVACWSARDVAEFACRNVPVNYVVVGCPWVAPLYDYSRTERGPGRVALWAPSWNREFSRRVDVVRALRALVDDGWTVRIRPHWATEWREPDVVAGWRREFRVLDASGAPYLALVTADVVICDVSGIALLANAAPAWYRPAVVHIDPPTTEIAQFDPNGPEWLLRDRFGERVDPRGDDGEILAAVRHVDAADNECVISEWIGPPASSRDAGYKLCEAIEAMFGKGPR